MTVLYYPYFWIDLAMTVSLHLAAKRERRQLMHAAAMVTAVTSET